MRMKKVISVSLSAALIFTSREFDQPHIHEQPSDPWNPPPGQYGVLGGGNNNNSSRHPVATSGNNNSA
jgi:hypothetical protein